MPTGYTADIYHGKDVSFKDFVLTCARSRGALIHMREEPLDVPIRKRDNSNSYHLEEIKRLNKEIEYFINNLPSRELLEKEYDKKVDELRKEDIIRNKEVKALKRKYEAMLDNVKKWNPPTREFDELKRFMIEQLMTSIDGDCHEWDSLKYFPTKEDWVNDKITNKTLSDELKYHIDAYNKECESIERTNAWIDTLVASLG